MGCAAIELACAHHQVLVVVTGLPAPAPSADVLAEAAVRWARAVGACGETTARTVAVSGLDQVLAVGWAAMAPHHDFGFGVNSETTQTPQTTRPPDPQTPPSATAPAPDGTTHRPGVHRDRERWARAAWFSPFESRPGAAVVRLTFRYDADVVAALKAELRRLTPLLRDPERRVFTAGGWLPEHRAWFIERAAWPPVRALLERHGYTVDGPLGPGVLDVRDGV